MIHGKQILEWLWVFQPWFGKNKTVIVCSKHQDTREGTGNVIKVFFSIQSKKKNVRQWKETQFSTPFVVKAATSLLLNSLKIYLEGINFLLSRNWWISNFETTHDESWNWSLSSLAKYASWSHEQIKRWRNLTVLKFYILMRILTF